MKTSFATKIKPKKIDLDNLYVSLTDAMEKNTGFRQIEGMSDKKLCGVLIERKATELRESIPKRELVSVQDLEDCEKLSDIELVRRNDLFVDFSRECRRIARDAQEYIERKVNEALLLDSHIDIASYKQTTGEAKERIGFELKHIGATKKEINTMMTEMDNVIDKAIAPHAKGRQV